MAYDIWCGSCGLYQPPHPQALLCPNNKGRGRKAAGGEGGGVQPRGWVGANNLSSSVGPFGYACAPLYAREHVKQRTLGQEPTDGVSIDLDVPLSPPFTTKATDSRALTRSNLAVYLIQTRLPESVAKRECSAGSAEGPRSKRQRGARPANDTSFRKVTTGKTTAWNCTSRQQILRVKVPEAALSEPASIS
jgi:hypothetical protein